MFKAPLLIGIFFVGIALLLGIAIFPIRERDYAYYEELLKSSNPPSEEALLSYSQQKREGVCKQIWYQDTTPLYFRIDSAESELFFFRQANQIEVIEQLGDVDCLMQEELYYEEGKPMQRVRHMKAIRACYNYNTHLFVAEEVKLWKYQLPGHSPPTHIDETNPVMRATAHSVEFTLHGNKLDFTAHQMRATMNVKEAHL
jgi:hypothetical protein